MLQQKIVKDSFAQAKNSSLVHEAVDLSLVDYTAPRPFKGLHVGVAGDVSIVGLDGTATVFKLAAGGHPYGGTGVIAADTTATDLVALY